MAFFIFLMMFGYRIVHELSEDNNTGKIIAYIIYGIGFIGVQWLYRNLKEKI